MLLAALHWPMETASSLVWEMCIYYHFQATLHGQIFSAFAHETNMPVCLDKQSCSSHEPINVLTVNMTSLTAPPLRPSLYVVLLPC